MSDYLENYIDGAKFHNGNKRQIYPEQSPENGLYFKDGKQMVKVAYRCSHENFNYPSNDPKHGLGLNLCRWLTSEQPDTKENFSKNLNGILESYLEPWASIGWHRHDDTEEIYVILEGTLYIECEDKNGNKFRKMLKAGDLHRVKPGMSHYGQAQDSGAKLLAIIINN